MTRRRDLWKKALEHAAGRELSIRGPASKAQDGPEIQMPRRSRTIVEAVREASEESAKRVLSDAFDDKRSELEEMAVRALRRSIEEEGDRLERLIEKSIEVKKREVRLSLLVLLVATTIYVVLAVTLG